MPGRATTWASWSRGAAPAALALAIGAAFTGSVLAEDADREHSTIRFARGLSDRGWFDLANAVLDDLNKDRSAPKGALEQAKAMRGDLLVMQASAEPDPAKRKKLMEEAKKFFEELSKGKGNVASDAKLRVGEVYLEAGDGALARLRATEDADERKANRTEAEEMYKQAAKFFADLKKDYDAAVNAVSDEMGKIDPGAAGAAEKTEELEKKQHEAVYQLARTCLLEARASYQQSQLFDAGKERDELLGKAAEGFSFVQFNYSDTTVGFEAAIFLGLVEKDRGHLDESVAAFDAAVAIMELAYPDGKKKNEAWDPYVGDIVSRALFLKTQTYNEKGAFDKALESSKKFLDYFGEWVAQNNRLALSLKLEEAKALAGTGKEKDALKIIETVEKADKNGPLGIMARKALADLTGKAPSGGGGLDLSPEKGIAAADALIDNEKVPQGLNRLRQVIAELEAAGKDGEPMLPAVWFKLGRTYMEKERLDEALACFNQLARKFPKSEFTDKAIFFGATCSGKMNAVLPNDFDKGRNTEALNKLATEFPNSDVSKAAAFLLGNDAMGKKDYPGAAASYAKVTEAAGEFYDAALNQIGVAWMMEARTQAAKKNDPGAKDAFTKAEEAFAKCIKWCEEAPKKINPMKPERGVTLKKVGATAWLRIAEIRLTPQVKNPKGALDAAKSAEKVLGDTASGEKVEARYYLVQAQLAADDLPAAEAALQDLVSISAESKRTADCERDVAIALDAKAQEMKKDKGKETELTSTLARAADHYGRWIDVSVKGGLGMSYATAAKAGDRVFSIAILMNKLPETAFAFTDVDDLSKLPEPNRFVQAAKAYEIAIANKAGAPAPAPNSKSDLAEPWMVLVKLGQCYGFARRYDDALKAIEKAAAMEGFVGADGKIVVAQAQAKPLLLYSYADAAVAARMAGETDKKAYDKALELLERLITVAPTKGDLWWKSKFQYFECLYLKGDYTTASVGVSSLKRSNPDFDGGKFKPLFEDLLQKLEKKKP